MGTVGSVLFSPITVASKVLGAAFGILTSTVSFLGNVIMDTGANLIEFAKKAGNGTASLSDFYMAFKDLPFGLGLLASGFATLAQYVEKLSDEYKALSKTGAQFGGDLYAMRSASMGAGMTMQEFREVVSKNSETFAMAGQGVQKGVDVFSRGMRSLWYGGLRDDLLGLGVSASEAGTYMATYMKMHRYTGMAEGQNSADLAIRTRNYIGQLDSLAKMTGLHRDQLNESLKKAAADDNWQMFVSGMTDKQKDASEAIVAAGSLVGGKFTDEVLKPAMQGITVGLDGYGAEMDQATQGATITLRKQMLAIYNNEQLTSDQRKDMISRTMFEFAGTMKQRLGGLNLTIANSAGLMKPELSKLINMMSAYNSSFMTK
jgi:hypothetical protein